MNVVFSMAWRNIWRNKIRSVIIMLSVSIGLLAGIFVLGLYKGVLHSRLTTLIHSEVSHLQVHHPEFKKEFDPAFVLSGEKNLVDSLEHWNIIDAASKRSITHGMLATGNGSSGVQITGIEEAEENKVSALYDKLIEGNGFSAEKKNQLLVGKKLAKKVQLKLGSKLVLTFIDKDGDITAGAFRVAGIYQTENAPRDERIVYVRRNDLNSLLNLTNNEYHELAIILTNDDMLQTAASRLQALFPEYKTETWKEISPETRLMIETTDQYSFIFIIIIMLALSFGIINTMLMAVLERTRETGMLIALGMNRFQVFTLIVWETFLLTMTGVPFGLLLSWCIVEYYKRTGIDISSFAKEAMSGFGFDTIIYPEFPWEKIVNTMIIVFFTALLSSLFPSIKAIRLQPIDAIRQ